MKQTAFSFFERFFLWMLSWPTVNANPSQKRNFSKNLSKPEEFGNAGFAFSCTCGCTLFENDGVSIITKFP